MRYALGSLETQSQLPSQYLKAGHALRPKPKAEKDPNYGKLNNMVFNISVDDVANWCGQPTHEVQRVISQFVKQGKVELFADRIVVPNINDLGRIVAAKRKSNQ